MRKGWDVRSASTVAEGLSCLDPAPDCILLDLMLPDGEGETLFRHVRAAGLPSRVIVTTGVGEEARIDRLRELGPAAVLRKPIDVREVFRHCLGDDLS